MKELGKVTLGLVDGTSMTGSIGTFTPHDMELPLYTGGSKKPQLIPGERVAYIGFHHFLSRSPQTEYDIKPLHLRVHVCGSTQFEVTTESTALSNPLGFFAFPVEPGTVFEKIYFYTHGINAKETLAPLGQMLVKAGALHPDRLEQGLKEQQKNKKIRLGNILTEQHNIPRETIDQAVELQKRKPLRIGELLVEAGWVTNEQVGQALTEQKKRRGRRLGQVLVDLELVTEEVVAGTLADKFLIPLVNLDNLTIPAEAAYAVPKEIIEKYGVLPVDIRNNSLGLAISDPLGVDAIEAVRQHCGCRVVELMVVPSQLQKYITECLARLEAESMETGMEQLLNELEEEERQQTASSSIMGKEEAVHEADSAVIRLVNRIIIDGFQRGASDIHIEPQGDAHRVRVRLRIDGTCQNYQTVPSPLRKAIVARIKIMSSLDIAERRKPQDGKIKFKTRGGNIELRVATLPTGEGDEDVVLRILASSKPLPPEKMKYSAANLEMLNAATSHPYGLFLCVGPTGSGKTTTLHSILGTLNQESKKIWTVEDPIEITQLGLRQVQVKTKIGLTFASVLRSFLRADPDIIMVGEMRDHETAHIGIESSLTGHLVLSTLHTNSAPETITRLIDMGLDPFSFADALLGILAQRLAKTLCPNCKTSSPGTRDEYDTLRELYGPDQFDDGLNVDPDSFELYAAPGCNVCRMSGYKGRMGVHELLISNDELKVAIGRKSPVNDLREIALKAGMKTLLQDGIEKVLQGHTDLPQILAVCR
jgi:type II secretory ATPase GspE/PulE/Tfp pilus assembly ATPase PilB-like protein